MKPIAPLTIAILISVTLLPLSAISQERPNPAIEAKAVALEIANSQASIRSEAELQQNLRSKSSPLHQLSPGAKERLIDSLVFTETGLGSMRTDDISRELSEQQIYELAKLFGVQFELPKLITPSVYDKEDQALYRLIQQPTTEGELQSCGGWPPSDSGCLEDGDVCVQMGGGRTCMPLPMNVCFSNCESSG
ncbi:hypothetical protein [Wenzhouxiangella sediminis]|uniref:hypothetical protein n=1 Tax=Wenzhouxiangella sediminis TaxID=1792836 RepID=UPI0011C01A7B|nr:hypothetical protein [Wenzhouxiangella sediminis]